MESFAVAVLLVSAAIGLGFYCYYNASFEGWILYLSVSTLMMMVAWGSVQTGRQFIAPDAEQTLAHDTRNPVVYLRPFHEDNRQASSLPAGKRNGGKQVVNGSWAASRERRLAHALKQIGPFVAVGEPGDKLAPLGAARLYLADDEWQGRVDALLGRAAAIVLCPESSVGTRWEVTEVARLVDRRRLLLIVPNPALRPLGYARIQALTQTTWPLPADCKAADAFMFDEQGRPQPLLFDHRPAAALRAFIDQIRRLGDAKSAPA
jgi:hypothetical protein